MILEKDIAKTLTARKKTLAVAESCCGGLLCHRLTNIPGSSCFFKLGVVAYSNEAKQKILKIPSALIKKHGAVSEPVAREMAENVRRLLKSDFAVSASGIAGPGGGTKAKPVGLVFIAAAKQGQTISQKFYFKGTRSEIKSQTADQALKMLKKIIL